MLLENPPLIDPVLADWFDNLSELEQDNFLSEVMEDLSLSDASETTVSSLFEPYKFEPDDYIRRFLKWEPWDGTAKQPGQTQVIEAYKEALIMQWEKYQYDTGQLELDQLTMWSPGTVIKNWIRVESGNLVGKTKLAEGVFSQFFDCFDSIIYTFAPSNEQLNDLLWKEIRKDRRNNNLPGKVQEIPRLKLSEDRFAKGKATNDAKGTGIERVQGQHNTYLMFILDEAEGIPDFVYDGIEGMDTGIIVIVLLLANPRTRNSKFHKIRSLPYVANFRINTLTHPNVVSGIQQIPGAATREWVNRRIDKYCEVVDTHDKDNYTFEVAWRPGIIYLPSPEFFWRVLGIAPIHSSDNTFCPLGRYEAAQHRLPDVDADNEYAQIGVDAARYGNDNGTVYCEHAERVWRDKLIIKKDGYSYYIAVKNAAEKLAAAGVKHISIRVDAGGGYGSTPVDNLRRDKDLQELFETFEVVEINNNARAKDWKRYRNKITELYYNAGERLKVLHLVNPADELEMDLCYRIFKHVLYKGRDVKQLESKEQFKARYLRSPDDGDGLVYCLAPASILKGGIVKGSDMVV